MGDVSHPLPMPKAAQTLTPQSSLGNIRKSPLAGWDKTGPRHGSAVGSGAARAAKTGQDRDSGSREESENESVTPGGPRRDRVARLGHASLSILGHIRNP